MCLFYVRVRCCCVGVHSENNLSPPLWHRKVNLGLLHRRLHPIHFASLTTVTAVLEYPLLANRFNNGLGFPPTDGSPLTPTAQHQLSIARIIIIKKAEPPQGTIAISKRGKKTNSRTILRHFNRTNIKQFPPATQLVPIRLLFFPLFKLRFSAAERQIPKLQGYLRTHNNKFFIPSTVFPFYYFYYLSPGTKRTSTPPFHQNHPYCC